MKKKLAEIALTPKTSIIFDEDDYIRLHESALAVSELKRMTCALPVDDESGAVMSMVTMTNDYLWEFYQKIEERWDKAKEGASGGNKPNAEITKKDETDEETEPIPLDACHAVSDIAESLKAMMTVLYEANFEQWNIVRDMLAPIANRLYEITEEHFPD